MKENIVENRKYYEAYDDRYKQIHDKSLQWFSDKHSSIISTVIEKYNICKTAKILEIGCGEGRDANYLLKNGYNLLATDISESAIEYCRESYPEKSASLKVVLKKYESFKKVVPLKLVYSLKVAPSKFVFLKVALVKFAL